MSAARLLGRGVLPVAAIVAGLLAVGGARQLGVARADAQGPMARAGVGGDTALARDTSAKGAGADAGETPVLMREVYTYDDGGRRDPFLTLLTSSEIRPMLVDLRLGGIIFDPSGRRSVAVMRDLGTKQQYRVTVGMTLGRMRVAEIRRRAVIFAIEEFGFSRRDSLVLGDSTKAVKP